MVFVSHVWQTNCATFNLRLTLGGLYSSCIKWADLHTVVIMKPISIAFSDLC